MTDGTDAGRATATLDGAGGSRVKDWLLLRANRLLVAAVLTGTVFVAFVVAVATLPPPFARQVASSNTIEAMFSTMIVVVVTGTTLVVTIGQLILTQEEGPLGDQHQRMSDTMDVRKFVEELVGAPTPADPAAFLGELIGVTARRAAALGEAIDGNSDEGLREDVDRFADEIVENAETVREELDGARFGSFDVVSAALKFEYSSKIYRIERIEHEYEGRLDDDEVGLLEDLKMALSMFGPAREHVKTLYFQWALIDLSRLILYAAVPSIAVAGVVLSAVDSGTFPGSTFGVDHLVLVVGGAFAVTLVPFMLFVSYILRVLTVAQRTLAIGPLVLRETRE